MRRRDVLKLLTASAALPVMGGSPPPALAADGERASRKRVSSGRMPVIFLAHGAPPLLDDAGWMAELAAWAQKMPVPSAILMVSAHWEHRPVAIGATRPSPLVYDFYGFPQRFYEIQYPAPGAPAVAERVRQLARGAQIPFVDTPERGLDHGTYVPLIAMYPHANIPVLQVSLPGLDPKASFELGRALAPLRDEGVLVVGSGFITHNLRAGFTEETPSWAAEFDAWAQDALKRWDIDALVSFRTRAPGAAMALPTHEHYVPLLVAAGAAADEHPSMTFPIEGFWFGSFTRRSVQYG
jgi:4,5-DOPA dioxygenase extradiol